MYLVPRPLFTEGLSKEGVCEPSQLGFLCSSHGSISAKLVTKVCGGNAELQALRRPRSAKV